MPIPSDTTLAALRTKLDRAVEKAERAAAKASTSEAGASEGDAPQLLAARTQRETLDKLVSTTPQMEEYRRISGAKWSERFTPVATFIKQKFFGYEGKQLVEHLWRQLPNSRFKRFQEAFCEPADYAIPKPNLSAPAVVFPTKVQLNTCSLAGCLVNPARIPFKLLVDLGIVPEPDRKLSELEALAIKSQPRVIQSLKASWESTTPIARGNHRFSAIRPMSDETAHRYPEAVTIPAHAIGSLIYTRENVAIDRSAKQNKGGEWIAPQLIPSLFSNLYAARRKTDHQSSTHRLETETIGELAVRWNTLTTKAREEWRRDTPEPIKEAIRSELKELAAHTRTELKGVDHHLKQRAAEKISALEERLQDTSKVKNNITSHIVAANAAVTKLEKRLREVPHKRGHNTVDHDQLSQSIKVGEAAFELIQRAIYGAGSLLSDQIKRRDGFFAQRFVTEEERDQRGKILLSQMRIPATALDQIPLLRPFRAFEAAHRSAYNQLRTALSAQDATLASAAIVKLVILSKLQRANVTFEALRRLTSCSDTVTLKELRKHANSLRTILEAKSPLPYTLVPEYDEFYQSVLKRVQTIARRLEQYADQDLDLEAETQMYSRLRAYLDTTDLEGATIELMAREGATE
jgi:hypothetical protein